MCIRDRPDIGILPELGKALGVTVDEILMGEQIEQEKRAETAVILTAVSL